MRNNIGQYVSYNWGCPTGHHGDGAQISWCWFMTSLTALAGRRFAKIKFFGIGLLCPYATHGAGVFTYKTG